MDIGTRDNEHPVEVQMLDLYQPCPCHLERKLKFCCGKDVVVQLGKVIEMLEGGQRSKAMQVLDKAIESHGHRDCLVSIRFGSEIEADKFAEARAIAEGYHAENGATSLYWTMQSLLALYEGQSEAAIDAVQSALETGETPSAFLNEAILKLAVDLHSKGVMISARDHFGLYLRLSSDPQGLAARYLQSIRESTTIPAAIKHDWPLAPIPEGREWSSQAAQAVHWAEQGRWRKALSVLEPLAKANPTEPALWKNVAILAGRLIRRASFSDAWTQYAQCPGVQPDHAIEAELAALLGQELQTAEYFDRVIETYQVDDLESLIEQAGLNPELEPFFEEQKVALAIRPDEVPKTGFMVSFTRWNPSLAPVAEESSESGNRPTGDHRFVMVVYGRRTDRSAEVVFPITNTPSVRKAIESLLDLYPQIKRDSKSVEILGEEVFWNAEFSFDSSFGIRAGGSRTSSPEEQRRKWQEQLLTLLPEKSTALLDGKTFREAAADPALRRRLEAVLMVMQEDFSNSFDVTEVFQRLRETLGLPAKEAINPKQVRLPDLSLAQFARLDFSVMPTQMLAWAMNVAASTANLPALRSLLGEVTRRVETTGEEILQTFPLAHLYLLLAQIEGDATAAQDHLENGLKYISDPIEAKVNWLVQGLETAISRRLGPPMMKLWEMLADLSDQNEYALNQYARICSLIGLDPPMRNPNPGPGGPRSQASAGGRAAAVAATVSQPVDTISDEPAVKPSKLWLPGEE